MSLSATRRILRSSSVLTLFCMMPVTDASGEHTGWLTAHLLGTLDRGRTRDDPAAAPWHAAAYHWLVGTGNPPSQAADVQGAISLCDSVTTGGFFLSQNLNRKKCKHFCVSLRSRILHWSSDFRHQSSGDPSHVKEVRQSLCCVTFFIHFLIR